MLWWFKDLNILYCYLRELILSWSEVDMILAANFLPVYFSMHSYTLDSVPYPIFGPS